MRGVSLTHPMLAFSPHSFCGEFLLHIQCCFLARSLARSSCSCSSCSSSFFMWGVSLRHPMLALFFYLGSFSYTSRAGFIFIWGVSLTHSLPVLIFIWGVSHTHPVLSSVLCKEFLLHISCWLHFSLGSFSYTSHAGFIFTWGVSLTHPVLASFFMWGASLECSLL